MERGDSKVRAGSPSDAPGEAVAVAPQNGQPRSFGSQRVGEILGKWQAVELRVARGFAECRGLGTEQLEDIYQETALALYRRPYASEEHLRNALRTGIKQRALRLHRDERRRNQILVRSTPGLRVMAEAQEDQRAPEPAVLAHEDRLIAREFLTELSEDERRVFGWLVEGLAYRAIASVESIPVNEARNLARACARKRERFQLLYDTGRLCGYRAQTIQALQHGQSTSEELAERVFAHLESCVHCRLEHKTNAKRLRASFRDQAAALLPPVLVGHLGWLSRLGVRARMLLHRLGIDTVPFGQGGVRERAIAVLAGGGASAKIAVGVVTLSVLAGGAVATHVLEQSAPAKHHHAARSATVAPPPAALTSTLPFTSPLPTTSKPRTGARRSVRTSRRARHQRAHRSPSGTRRLAGSSAGGQREPGGFAYLGVPTTTSAPAAPARTASSSEDQHGGGQFSP
ncbi:MAG TPA: sigma-70 family RNA polymerase sigma factor [Solirubrobacteraceae bacterium]|nr:sigma-70 family RNA polymerase sigma factor [Solirubrobacteraceae bacterium]